VNPKVRRAGAVAEKVLHARDVVAGSPAYGLTIVGWHRIDSLDGGLSTTPDEFRRHLGVLESFHVLSLDEGVRRLAKGTLPRRAVALTFDDGYASVADVAWPLLKARRWPATFYVCSGYLRTGRFPWDTEDVPLVSSGTVRDLAADGMAIGSHTVTHRWLPHLPPADVRREVSDDKVALEDVLGAPVTTFSYPMGGWTKGIRDVVRAAGHADAVTVDRGRNGRSRDPMLLRRSFAPRDVADLRKVLVGAYTFLRPVDRWRTRNGPVF
jgi:peptidoglycan/xylan/chitin deacetylase (PgdA/CDA1 family)